MTVVFEYREMTKDEYKREQLVFDNQNIEFGNSKEIEKRFGYVATDNGVFVGASSGLIQKYGDQFGTYFYLSDLVVEKEYRKQGYGKKLLELLEAKVKSLGAKYIWTWTATYEAESFYTKLGYETFTRFEKYYPSGHARVGLMKKL